MKYTPNLNLKKPDGTDIVDIDDFNLNFDTLDTEILKRVEKTKKLTTSYDLNTLVNTGFYNVENPVNAPSGIAGWCYIISIKYSESTSYLAQFLIPFGSNRMFFRRKSSTWQIWIELANKEYFINELTKKVDKISGKGLSTNDYTTAEKNKLAGIETGANKTTINNTLTSTSTTQALSAKQGKTLKDDLDEHKAENVQQFENLENALSNIRTNDVQARREILDIKLKLDEMKIVDYLNKTGIGFYDLFTDTKNIDTTTTTTTVDTTNANVTFVGTQLLKMLSQKFDNIFNTLELSIYDKEREDVVVDNAVSSSNQIQLMVKPDSVFIGDRFYYNGQVYTITGLQEV